MGAEGSGGARGEAGPEAGAAPPLDYRHLIEFARDGHLLTDARGVVVEANLAASLALRCPKEFLVGKPLGLFVVAAHRPRFYRALARLRVEAEADEFEVRAGRRGVLRDLAVRVAPAGAGPDGATAFRWIVRDVTDQRRAESARDDLLRRLVTAQEEERRRVARELHDSVGQLLTALLLDLRALRDAGPLRPEARRRLDAVQRVADELVRATHDLAVRLRPTALDDVGLQAALRHYLEDWSARTGVAAQFQAVGEQAGRFPPEVETTLYRVVQEALTNVARHAGARRAGVIVERQGGRAVAIVEDDGVGFDPEAAARSDRLGLRGMRERLALVGGGLEVESAPGAGTTIIAWIPLGPRPTEDAHEGFR